MYTSLKKLDADNYRALADAIIIQAVKDYRRALKAKRTGEIRLINKFFRSEFFGVLTNIDPETLIQKLNMEVKSR